MFSERKRKRKTQKKEHAKRKEKTQKEERKGIIEERKEETKKTRRPAQGNAQIRLFKLLIIIIIN